MSHSGIKILPLLVGGLAGWQSLACAQGAPAAEVPPAEESGPQLQEIIVTAQKLKQNLQSVPISIGVLTAEQLDRQAIVSGPQLAQATPSLSFTDNFSPSTASLSMRGLGSYVFEGGIQPSVGMVVDGVVLARPGEFITELADIERIEVLRGPQGTLFGKNATAGALNITRKAPTAAFEGALELSQTNDDETLVRAMVSGPLSESVRGRLVGYYRNLEPYIENLNREGGDAGGVDSYGFAGKLDIDLSEDVNLLLSGDFRDATHGNSPQKASVADFPARIAALGNGDPVLGQRVLDDHFKVNFNKPGDENRSEGYGVSADLTWSLPASVRFKSISAYRWAKDRNNPDVDSTPADANNLVMPIINVNNSQAPGGTKLSRETDWHYFTQELRLEGSGSVLDWVAGGFYSTFKETVRNDVSLLVLDAFADPTGGGANLGGTPAFGDEYFLNNGLSRGNADDLDSLAFFGDVTWHATDRLNVFGGLRWTREKLTVDLNNYGQFADFSIAQIGPRYDAATGVFNTDDIPVFQVGPGSVGSADKTSSDVSGRAGMSFNFSDDVTIYGSASRGFVGAGASLARNATVSNAILKPTTATAFEAGIKSYLFDRRLRLNVALFHQKTEDLQTARLIPGTVNSEAVNAGNLKSRGVEADLTWLLNRVLSVDASVTWLHTEFSDLVQPCYFGQTTAQGCTVDSDGNGVGDQQNVSGKGAINTPKLKYNIGLNFDMPLSGMAWDLYSSAAYVWQDKVQFNLNYDPLTTQDSYGLLDLTLGMRSQNDRYDVALFGRNVTDKYYDVSMSEAFGALGRVFVRPPRDAQAYYGLRAKVNF